MQARSYSAVIKVPEQILRSSVFGHTVDGQSESAKLNGLRDLVAAWRLHLATSLRSDSFAAAKRGRRLELLVYGVTRFKGRGGL